MEGSQVLEIDVRPYINHIELEMSIGSANQVVGDSTKDEMKNQ